MIALLISISVISAALSGIAKAICDLSEDAQNDQSLQVGELYQCNGFIMYKQ